MSPLREPAGRAVRVLHGLALAVLATVVVSAVAQPLFYWDSWAYHLPFSALLWNIGDARRTFVLSEEMRWRYEGFPLLAEFLQGALWKLTGSIKATTLVNALALAGFVLAAGKSLRLSVPLLAFGMLAVPLVALHATSNYIDLFVGVCVCFQTLAAVKLLAENRRGQTPVLPGPRGQTPILLGSALQGSVPDLIEGTPHARWIVAYIAAAAAAGNSKFTALILSFAVSAFVLAYLLVRRREIGAGHAKKIAAAVAVASVLAAGTALKNTYTHSNPAYPFDMRVLGVHLQGPEPQYSNYPDYTAPLGVLARPVNWLLSISEVDWIVRGVEPGYSLDLSGGDKPARYGPARTGGDCGPLVVASALLAIGLAALARRRSRETLRAHRPLLALFAWLSVVTAFGPQSHELRYSLHWPLLLMVVVAALVNAAQLSTKARVRLVTAYLVAFIASEAMLDFPLQPWPPVSGEEIVHGNSSAPEIAHAKHTGGVCLGPDYNPQQFAYSAAVNSGDYVIEQGWTRCVVYPPYGRGK